jgi:hypothetical protein
MLTITNSISNSLPNFIWQFFVLPTSKKICQVQKELISNHLAAFARVCQILVSKSCVLPTSKKICQVKKSSPPTI